MPVGSRPCDAHLDLFNFKYALPHLTESLKRQRKIKIVAIGSSSTAGKPTSCLIRRHSKGASLLMQYWVEHDKIPIKKLARQGDLNKLHMSDWATNCIAAALFHSIKRAVEAEGAT
jgi:hypothetical protein